MLVFGAASHAQDRPSMVSTAATLTVLSGDVSHVTASGREPRRVVQGVDLAEGERVVTRASGRALITFLDGTTVTVEPGSDVTVRRIDVQNPQATSIRLLASVGTIWARIASVVGARSTVSVESSNYVATANEGLIGAQQKSDTTFVCWTRAGTLRVEDRTGLTVAVLEPGQKTTVWMGRPPLTERFSVNDSVLEVRARGALPLVVMPNDATVAGFVPPGVDVNQVFGSLTTLDGGLRLVEVPAGRAGTYTLVLSGTDDGAFTVSVAARVHDASVQRHEVTGRIRSGERLAVTIVVRVAGDQTADPKTARIESLTVGAPGPLAGRLPGVVLLSPRELESRPR
jgi:hypothetical protein